MKTYIALFVLLTVFFGSTVSATSQEVKKTEAQIEYDLKKREYANSKKQILKTEDVAKRQSENLQQLLNLNEEQGSRVYDICFAVEEKMEQISTLNEEKKMSAIRELDIAKNEKLKEVLTEEQFETYMKSVRTDKK